MKNKKFYIFIFIVIVINIIFWGITGIRINTPKFKIGEDELRKNQELAKEIMKSVNEYEPNGEYYIVISSDEIVFNYYDLKQVEEKITFNSEGKITNTKKSMGMPGIIAGSIITGFCTGFVLSIAFLYLMIPLEVLKDFIILHLKRIKLFKK